MSPTVIVDDALGNERHPVRRIDVENADTDDAAQADTSELPQAEHRAEIAALTELGLQLLDRFVPRQTRDQAHKTYTPPPKKTLQIIARNFDVKSAEGYATMLKCPTGLAYAPSLLY